MIESLIFSFGHRAQHGKDTVAEAIIKQRSGQYQIKHIAFAQALKQEVNEMAERSGGMKNLFLRLDFPSWVTYDPNPDMSDPYSPLGKQRKLLQFYGVHKREQDENYWVKRVVERLEREQPEVAVLTDLRFPNEMAFCKAYGEVIKVERRNSDGTIYQTPGILPHISEEALAHIPDSDWSAVLVNDGTLDQLKVKGVELFDRLMECKQGVEQEASQEGHVKPMSCLG